MADEWEGNRDAELLRAIQRWDEHPIDTSNVLTATQDFSLRVMTMGVASVLGIRLGLQCTGEYEGGGFWKHNGGTCPIHEWLVPSDSSHFDPSESEEVVLSAKR